MHFSQARKIGSHGCSHSSEDVLSFLGESKKTIVFHPNTVVFVKIPPYFLPDTVVFIQCLYYICLQISPNNTVFAPNIIRKPHNVHFSHSYKGLGKCTFLKLYTMHFCTAQTAVHLTGTAGMEACTFLKNAYTFNPTHDM